MSFYNIIEWYIYPGIVLPNHDITTMLYNDIQMTYQDNKMPYPDHILPYSLDIIIIMLYPDYNNVSSWQKIVI